MKLKKALLLLAPVIVVGWAVDLLNDTGQFRSLKLTSPANPETLEGFTGGTEDLVFRANGREVFVSSPNFNDPTKPGGIFLVDVESRTVENVTPPAWLEAGKLQPHGIDLWRDADGERLFVVNHPGGTALPQAAEKAGEAGGHTVEVFDVSADGELTHRETVSHELFISPNDVAAASRDSFYVTNDHGYGTGIMRTVEDYARLRAGNVVFVDGARQAKEVWSGTRYANGIKVSADGKNVYLAETTAKSVTWLERDLTTNALTLVGRHDTGTGVDNLDVAPDGSVWTAAHPKMLTFLSHSKDPANVRSPSEVLKLVPGRDGWQQTTVYLNDGDPLSSSSVAATNGEVVVVGSVFDPRLVLWGAPAPSAEPGLAALADDWQEALRRGKESGKLLFVDAWAPWCHTCWSMKRDVLADPALARFDERFLFVEIDTDKPENAPFTTRFPVRVWPTFFVIDPGSEAIVATHGGSMSLAELKAFLETAAAARAGGGEADDAMAAGYQALQAGTAAEAVKHFQKAAASEGPRRMEATHAAVRALRGAGDFSTCATFASASLERAEGSAAAGDLAVMTLLCSSKLPDQDPLRRTAQKAAQEKLEALVAAPAADSSVDDRADVMATLANLYAKQSRADDATSLHERRLRLLEDDAARAKTPEGSRVHDYARMNSYLYLGRGDDAVALFQERLGQLPDDYESAARLASTLFELGRFDEAQPMAEKAVELSYGPRRLRYLKLLADTRASRGDQQGEREALEHLVKSNEALPAALRLDDVAEAARARLGS